MVTLAMTNGALGCGAGMRESSSRIRSSQSSRLRKIRVAPSDTPGICVMSSARHVTYGRENNQPAMAKKKTNAPAPLTFDLPVSLIGKLGSNQKKLGLKSASEVVRLAISEFNFEKYEASAEEHRQISVRLPADIKTKLTKVAKKKSVSVGELLRVAIDNLEAKKAAKKK
jgi:Arc/MetJ-type ribon-helix-helix transcriptional regulator